ncbi:hypothetical protein HY024_03460 [Candidatus Curtissbacteria bacterium]|nr:hypothetical protein [Candidatus Curtissbacteria bacterium]
MKKVIVAFLIWRIVLFIVAAQSPLFIKNFAATFPYYQERLISTHLPHFIWAFGNFDGVHYLGIASHAYSDQFTQAFFPFYPLLIKLVTYMSFGNLLISGLIISNVAFFAALLLFYKLIEKNYGEKLALWSSLFLLAFPTSFYFGSVYTEAIFLLEVVSFYYLQDIKKPFLSAIVGAFAAFTRLIGVFLALIFLKKDLKSLVYGVVVSLGLFVYMVYLWFNFKNPLYFLSSQSIFGQNRETDKIVLLPQVLFRYLKILTTAQGSGLYVAIFEFSITIIAFLLLALAFRTYKKSWVIFGLASIILPTLTGTLASMPRYVIIAFPIYLVLAQIKSTALKILIIVASSALGTIALSFFAQGYWVA